MKNIVLFGSNYIASHIALLLIGEEDSEQRTTNKIHIIETRKDPYALFLNHPPFQKRWEIENGRRIRLHHASQWDSQSMEDLLRSFGEIDYVINTSFIHASDYSRLNPKETLFTNCLWTGDMMNALRRIPNFGSSGHVIHISTASVYGKQEPEKLPLTEDVLPNPVGNKAASRLAQENIISGMGKGYGLPYTILRTGTHYGLYTPDDTVMAIFARNAISGEPLVVQGDGAQSRDFTNIEDVAQAVLKCTKVGNVADYQTINIGAGDKYEHNIITLAGIFEALLKNYKRVDIEKTAWRSMKEEKDLRIHMDIAKAKKLLGYSPLMDTIFVIRDFIKFVASYNVGVNVKEMAKIEEAIQMGGADMDRLVQARDEDLAKYGEVKPDNPYLARMKRYGETDIPQDMLDYEKRTAQLVKEKEKEQKTDKKA